MAARVFPVFAACLLSMSAAAATVARHTMVEVDASGKPTGVTEIVASGSGDLMFLNYAVTAGTSEADASRGSGRGPLTDKMVFRAATEEVISVQGSECHRFSAADAAPGGMAMGDMQQYQQQMRAAQSEMEKAFAEMARQNPEMAEKLKESMAGRFGGGGMMPARPEYEVIETGRNRNIDRYDTVEIEVREKGSGRLAQTVWAAPVSEVDGGALIARNMKHMLSVFEATMEKMGAGAMTGSGIMGAIGERLDTHFPVLSIDPDETRTRLVSVDEGGSVDFDVRCDGGRVR